MSNWRRDLLEFVRPGSVRRKAIPPLEAGLRPNSRLDRADVLAQFGQLGVDDIAVLGGDVIVSAGQSVARLGADSPVVVADLPGAAGALASSGTRVVVAVEGHGLVSVGTDGSVQDVCTDERVRSCVTSIALAGDDILVCVGSRVTTIWARNLVEPKAPSGMVLRVSHGNVTELATGLDWPAGICMDGTDEFLLSISGTHTIERRSLTNPRAARPFLANLPGHPGRLTPGLAPGEWWVAVPYLRNRATELILEDSDLVAEMLATTEPGDWLVPALAIENIYRTPLQVGSVRVLGEIKPWSPPRTYGLVFRVDDSGRILESAHSRADGRMHGVTGLHPTDSGTLLVVCKGPGTVLALGADT